jgi:hypothetical protein
MNLENSLIKFLDGSEKGIVRRSELTELIASWELEDCLESGQISDYIKHFADMLYKIEDVSIFASSLMQLISYIKTYARENSNGNVKIHTAFIDKEKFDKEFGLEAEVNIYGCRILPSTDLPDKSIILALGVKKYQSPGIASCVFLGRVTDNV